MRSWTEWPFEKYDRLRYGENLVEQKDFGYDHCLRCRTLSFEVIEGYGKGQKVTIPLDDCFNHVDRYKKEMAK